MDLHFLSLGDSRSNPGASIHYEGQDELSKRLQTFPGAWRDVEI